MISGILSVESYPGNNYSYSLEGIKAVLLKPYHSATLYTSNRMLELFCKRASDMGIPVFVVNVKSGIRYESTKLFEKLKIIPLPYSTYVSAYMKIWAAISLGKDVKAFSSEAIGSEIV